MTAEIVMLAVGLVVGLAVGGVAVWLILKGKIKGIGLGNTQIRAGFSTLSEHSLRKIS